MDVILKSSQVVAFSLWPVTWGQVLSAIVSVLTIFWIWGWGFYIRNVHPAYCYLDGSGFPICPRQLMFSVAAEPQIYHAKQVLCALFMPHQVHLPRLLAKSVLLGAFCQSVPSCLRVLVNRVPCLCHALCVLCWTRLRHLSGFSWSLMEVTLGSSSSIPLLHLQLPFPLLAFCLSSALQLPGNSQVYLTL